MCVACTVVSTGIYAKERYRGAPPNSTGIVRPVADQTAGVATGDHQTMRWAGESGEAVGVVGTNDSGQALAITTDAQTGQCYVVFADGSIGLVAIDSTGNAVYVNPNTGEVMSVTPTY